MFFRLAYCATFASHSSSFMSGGQPLNHDWTPKTTHCETLLSPADPGQRVTRIKTELKAN